MHCVNAFLSAFPNALPEVVRSHRLHLLAEDSGCRLLPQAKTVQNDDFGAPCARRPMRQQTA